MRATTRFGLVGAQWRIFNVLGSITYSIHDFHNATSYMDTTEQSTLLSDVKKSPSAADSCVICLETISERAVTLPCNHVNFDFICILSWLLDQQARCPLCKTEVDAVQYAFDSPTDFKTFHIPSKTGVTRKGGSRSFSFQSRLRRRTRSPPPAIDNALLRRKFVYTHNLYSMHIGTNRISKHRNITPSSFSASTDLHSRARKWIRRELQVFEFLSPDYDSSTANALSTSISTTGRDTRNRSLVSNNVEALLEYIILVLEKVQIKGADGRAEDLIQEYLGRENARLFLHELEAWLRAPYHTLEEWDGVLQYAVEIPYPLPEVRKRSAAQGDSIDAPSRISLDKESEFGAVKSREWHMFLDLTVQDLALHMWFNKRNGGLLSWFETTFTSHACDLFPSLFMMVSIVLSGFASVMTILYGAFKLFKATQEGRVGYVLGLS
ncbi:hypothetical protein E2P81_ATG07171 [Venturia nashicola]|nr:hypothetical protein E2P81_ATG07171 [Venturia nashicola]